MLATSLLRKSPLLVEVLVVLVTNQQKRNLLHVERLVVLERNN